MPTPLHTDRQLRAMAREARRGYSLAPDEDTAASIAANLMEMDRTVRRWLWFMLGVATGICLGLLIAVSVVLG